jgi:hypothetical protein
MAVLGQAAVAMWWDIAADVRADFEHWHAHEHFPERLAIPGFLRGTRWSSASGGEGMFVLYELERHATLSSPEYLARLNAPTPWSTRLMPHHRHMIRSQCHVVASHGSVVARRASTLRLSPATGRGDALRSFLASLASDLAQRPGLMGAHLLRHEAPDIETTKEQAIRNHADRHADWIFVVCGYAESALEALRDEELSAARLCAEGATADPATGLYALACSATSRELE